LPSIGTFFTKPPPKSSIPKLDENIPPEALVLPFHNHNVSHNVPTQGKQHGVHQMVRPQEFVTQYPFELHFCAPLQPLPLQPGIPTSVQGLPLQTLVQQLPYATQELEQTIALNMSTVAPAQGIQQEHRMVPNVVASVQQAQQAPMLPFQSTLQQEMKTQKVLATADQLARATTSAACDNNNSLPPRKVARKSTNATPILVDDDSDKENNAGSNFFAFSGFTESHINCNYNYRRPCQGIIAQAIDGRKVWIYGDLNQQKTLLQEFLAPQYEKIDIETLFPLQAVIPADVNLEALRHAHLSRAQKILVTYEKVTKLFALMREGT